MAELVPLGVVEFEFCVPENGVEIDSRLFLPGSDFTRSLTRDNPFSPPGFNKGSIGRMIGVSVFRFGNSVTWIFGAEVGETSNSSSVGVAEPSSD